MIYLIRSYGEKGSSILKVGFTSDIHKRTNCYFYHNPLSEVIKTKEGDKIYEDLLHRYLTSLGYRFEKLNEWYRDVPGVLEIFDLSFDDLCERVWKDRDKVFNPEQLVYNSKSYNVFELIFRKTKGKLNIIKYRKDENNKEVEDSSFLEVDWVFWNYYKASNDCISISPPYRHNYGEIESLILSLIDQFLNNRFHKNNSFEGKMEEYCKFLSIFDSYPEEVSTVEDLLYDKIGDDRFMKYYHRYKAGGCEALNYSEEELEQGIKKPLVLEEFISNVFKYPDISYTLKEIRRKFELIFESFGRSKKIFKISDIERLFKITRVKDPKFGIIKYKLEKKGN